MYCHYAADRNSTFHYFWRGAGTLQKLLKEHAFFGVAYGEDIAGVEEGLGDCRLGKEGEEGAGCLE